MKENQNVVVVANPPGSSSLYCRTVIDPLSHRYFYVLPLLLLRCCTTIVPLSFRCRYATVAPLSRWCHTAIAPVSLHSRSAAVTPAVNTQSHRYRTGIAPLSLRHCRSVVALLSRRYCTSIAPMLLRCCDCVATAGSTAAERQWSDTGAIAA